MMVDGARFVDLRRPRRIWAVAAVHAEVDRLVHLHDELGVRFRPGDRLVYLGNLIGHGLQVAETVDELLLFRRAVLAIPGVLASDVVYLRGGQEEMWQKLLQLHLAPNPREIVAWMLSQGMVTTLAAYGASATQVVAVSRDGSRSLARFTTALRDAMRRHPGHEVWFSALRRAAFTGSPMAVASVAPGVLLVNSGFDVARRLEAQGDTFWWGGARFASIDHRYGGFARIVRGYDPGRGGLAVNGFTTTLDAGCGFGGSLVCGCLGPDGGLLDMIEA